jgi:GMP synthase (glutamine-hydrolysing)
VDAPPNEELIRKTAPALTNRRSDVNRVVAVCGTKAPLRSFHGFEAYLTRERLDMLRCADSIVRHFCEETGFENHVWQFPVVLAPAGTQSARECVILRPVGSIDGMTAEAVLMETDLLKNLTERLLSIHGVSAVFYDVTNKPPGTIEWE